MAKVEKGKRGNGATPKSSAKKESAAPEISRSGEEHQFAPRLRDMYRRAGGSGSHERVWLWKLDAGSTA